MVVYIYIYIYATKKENEMPLCNQSIYDVFDKQSDCID